VAESSLNDIPKSSGELQRAFPDSPPSRLNAKLNNRLKRELYREALAKSSARACLKRSLKEVCPKKKNTRPRRREGVSYCSETGTILGSRFLSFCGLASLCVNFYVAFFVSPKFLVAYVVGNGFGILNCSLADTHLARNH
jgi:hypothetical protein